MHKIALAVAVLLSSYAGLAHNDQDLPALDQNEQSEKLINIQHKAFKPGERLTYRLTYGVFDAGEATFRVLETKRTIKGRKLLRMIATGKTVSAFEWFYKVDDLYESYMDAEALVPWIFKRRVDEGGYKFSQDYLFKQHKNEVETEKGNVHEVPDQVQDMISAFYYARTFDFSKAKKGDKFKVNIFLDEELTPTEIKYLGKEVVRTRKGKFLCHKFAPVVVEGRIFPSDDAATVYITADENKIPIMAKAKLHFGSVKMHLVKWEGLMNPMAMEK